MKKSVLLMLCVFLLSGCSAESRTLDRVMDARNALMEADGCSFTSVITADYEDSIYTFTMDCAVDAEGTLTFTVTDPETIRGITGRISNSGGALMFDDKILEFPLLADGQVTPVSMPWLFYRIILGGYISGCGRQGENLCVYYDDSFHEIPVHLEAQFDSEDVPVCAELYWNQRRILTTQIRNFQIL